MPFRLASLTSKRIIIRFVVRSGKDSRLFNQIDRRRVEGRELNREPFRYLANVLLVFLKSEDIIFLMNGQGW